MLGQLLSCSILDCWYFGVAKEGVRLDVVGGGATDRRFDVAEELVLEGLSGRRLTLGAFGVDFGLGIGDDLIGADGDRLRLN